MRSSLNIILALLGGLLLALMIDYNSQMAKNSSPLYASWVAHGIGSLVALFFIAVCTKIFSFNTQEIKHKQSNGLKRGPFWAYFGGIPGALTVVLAAISVNSKLALSGTLALMLVGQVIFGIIADWFGLFGNSKRRFTLNDFFVVLLIVTGSVLIIFFRN